MHGLRSLSVIFLLLYVLANSCYAQGDQSHRQHIENVVLSKVEITPRSFSICSQYGCNDIASLSIEPQLWSEFVSGFESVSQPAYERALLAEYIAHMEQYVGRKTGTQYDRAGSFLVFLDMKNQKSNQMDCIDESINTLTYLKMLQTAGKLQFHKISGLVTRGGLMAGYPHTAVLLVDTESQNKYVIDSWFYDNGRPASVIPYADWKRGWKPMRDTK